MISEFPLFVFTTLGGLAAGAYAMSAVFPVGKNAKRPWLFPLMCLVLLVVGLLLLPFHLGHPERMLNALSNPGAMIAQEAYWSAALFVVLLIDIIVAKMKGLSPRALRIVGAVVSLILVIIMANAYFVSTGVDAWSSWQTFLLYMFGDLAMGAALLTAFQTDLLDNGTYLITAIVLDALACLAMVLEAVHFAGVGSNLVLLVIGAIVAAVGAVLVGLTKAGKLKGSAAVWATFVCMFVAVAFARYGFYAACML